MMYQDWSEQKIKKSKPAAPHGPSKGDKVLAQAVHSGSAVESVMKGSCLEIRENSINRE